jgi:tRNA G18 (ribose-2'-O)-methylase SpoU
MRKLKNSELNRLNVTEFKQTAKIPLFVILDNIRSLNNIGSVFRTSDAFIIEKIYLCGITAKPPHKDIHKTALGATESVEWEYVSDTLELVKKLQKQNVKVIAIEQANQSIMLQDFEVIPNQTYAIIMGNEVKGVQQDVVSTCDYCIEIPQFGTKHSLNISVSTGVVLWDLFKKIKLLQN